MDPQILSFINALYLLIFVTLMTLSVGRLGYRIFKYWRNNEKIPTLLKRDFLFTGGLTLPFLGFLFFRFLNVRILEEPWYPAWLIGSGGLAIFGTAVLVYYEYFKIEQ